jgi:hypothetical protein
MVVQVDSVNLPQNQFSNTRYVAQAGIENWKNYYGLLKAVKKSPHLFKLGKSGEQIKLGKTIFLEIPNSYPAGDGPDISNSINGIYNVNVPFTVNTHKHVAIAVLSQEKVQNLAEMHTREWAYQTVDPMLANLISSVAATFTSGMALGVSNVFVSKDGNGYINPPGLNEWAHARAALKRQGVPGYVLKAAVSPETNAASISSMSTLFNPTMTIGDQTTKGRMTSPVGGIAEWYEDIYIPTCTTGSYTGGAKCTGTVGMYFQSTQTSMPGLNTYNPSFGASTVSCSAISGTLNQGDFITIDGVYEVNRLNGKSTGFLKVFTVMEDVPSGSTSIPVSPSIIGPNSSGGFAPFQTVSAVPASGAAITPVLPAGCVYKRNIIFGEDTFFCAFVEMSLDTPGAETTRASTGEAEGNDAFFSTIVSRQYNNLSQATTMRADVLGGWTIPFSDRGIVVPYVINQPDPTATTIALSSKKG